MKRVPVIAVLTVVTVAGAAAADAAVKKGTFTGTTSAADPVGFKVNKKGKVVSFFYEGVTLNCTDGDSLDTPTGAADRVQTPPDKKFAVTDGKWGIKAENRKTGFKWDVAAKFKSKGEKSTGTLSITAQFNDRNQQDPNGSITCTSGKLKFTTKRK